MRIILIFLIGSILVFSCKEKNTSAEKIEVVKSVLPLYHGYLVIVNDLRVRTEPGLDSEVTSKLKEGSLVYGENEKSEFEATITLRGKETTSPFFKVAHEKNNAGWVYGGALIPFYSGNTPSPFTGRLEDAAIAMNNVNLQDKDAGKQILEILRTYKGSDATWNDALMVIGAYYFNNFPEPDYKEFENLTWEEGAYQAIQDRSYDMNQRTEAQNLKANGYMLDASEGMIYPVIDLSAIGNVINGPFSKPMELYQQFLKKTTEQKFFSDGGIVAPIIAVADVVLLLENINESYPNFIKINEIKEEFEIWKTTLVFGSNNTPATGFESKEFESDFIEAWKYFIDKKPTSSISRQLKERI